MIDYKNYLERVRQAAQAHQEQVLPTAKTERVFPTGEKNQFFTHPLWASMMILLDTQLSQDIRELGSQALLFHDVLEDTSATLPTDLSPETIQLIKDMTYENFEQEVSSTFHKRPIIHLLKLYDKTASMYDGCLRSTRYPAWLDWTEKLIASVRKQYGELHIVLLSEALVKKYRKMLVNGTIPKLPLEKT